MNKIVKLTFAAACKIRKFDAKKIIASFKGLPKELAEPMLAHTKCVIMVAAANQIANDGKPWKPDYTDGSWKYETSWKHMGGSRGFLFRDYVNWRSSSDVGSRLCFKNLEVCKALTEANKEYIKYWNQYSN